ncbi:uncharacterized protein LOC133971388 [Platichthys flesus]|uniref:uncharacterized protein LOC133971388 n=1 Tax=Platichthys flesus TaxID=8260 RepID=UPI002DBD1B58|nr:uncharacterized protein LOC133971388 [Platichthys flesus]
MTLSRTLQAALIIPLCASAVDVTHIPVVCSDIQTQDGYKFPFDLPAGADLSILQGQTTIASWENGEQQALLPEVIRLGNNSVITRTCRDVLIQVSTVDDDQSVREHWLNYTATEGTTKPVLPTTGNPVTPGNQVHNTQFQNNTAKPDLPTPENQTANHGWIAYLFVVPLIIGLLLYCYWSRKKGSFLWLCNALKKRFSTKAERSEPAETRPLSVIEMQEILPTENQQNGISLENVNATHPSGSGENGVAQDSPRGSVHVVRIHPRCDGINSLDHKLENEEFQPTANGHLNIPDVDIASHHGDTNSVRNMRDDPGGSSGDVRLDIPEAEPLVNRGGQNQDHVNRCSVTPEPDVESKPRVKNIGDY